VELARRSREHDDRRPRSGSRRHHQPRRRAHRVENGSPGRYHGLLAVRRPNSLQVEPRPAAHQRAEDLGDLLFELRVEDHLASGELAHDLGCEIVGGRAQPAAGHDQRHPLGRHVPERRHEIAGPVADDLDHGGVDPDLEQALG
jgi:hypothetical protein